MSKNAIVVAIAALSMTACGGRAAPSPTPSRARGPQRLADARFTARYPAGWTKTIQRRSGALQYQLGSQGPLDRLGIPESGAIGITVLRAPLSMFEPAAMIRYATRRGPFAHMSASGLVIIG
jgi:hypothetical protein